MKALLFIPIAALLFACGTQKELVEQEEKEPLETVTAEVDESVMQNNYRVVGIVHVTEGGCGAYIEAMTEPDKMQTMYPVNLTDEFKVQGTKIKFDYALSRAPLPEGCMTDLTVTVTDVTRMRN